MRKVLILVSVWILALNAHAQDVESYEADSVDYYNSLYNPNDYAKAPIKGPQKKIKGEKFSTNVNLGSQFGTYGSTEFINPNFNYQATKKLQLSVGFGMAYSNLKYRSFGNNTEGVTYQNLKALTNYYSVSANYQASEKLQLTSSVIYFQNNYTSASDKNMFNRDAYMATFGATYQITPSFSIGVEVSNYKNVNPWGYGYGNPYFGY